MTKNPIINAAAAFIYIVVVVNVIDMGTRGQHEKSLLIPIAVLSMFTLSAGVMAYIFFYNPFQMYFDGKKKAAIELAFKSFATFAGITAVIIALLFSGILPK